MGTSPEQLKTEIEQTRARLVADLDQLAERVGPGHVARRAGNHPMTIGLVAFGAGLLIAVVIPQRPNERTTATRVAGGAATVAGRVGPAVVRMGRGAGRNVGRGVGKGVRAGMSHRMGRSAPRLPTRLGRRAARVAGRTAPPAMGRRRRSSRLPRPLARR